MIASGNVTAMRVPAALGVRPLGICTQYHSVLVRRPLSSSSTIRGLFGFGRSSTTDQQILLNPRDTFPDSALGGDQLAPKLMAQDPLGRIRFMRPAIADSEPFMILNERSVDEQPETVQTHLVPFWTVIIFAAHRWHMVNSAHGTSEIMPRGETNCDISFSVAAVGEDHWCRDLVLVDTLRRMRDGVVADMDTAVLYEAQSVKLDDPAHYWNYFFKMHRFLPDECALFARGYPKLSDAVLKATIEQAAYKSIDEPIYMPKAMVSEPLQIRAFPTYRVAYKANFKDRTEYWDGWLSRSKRTSPVGDLGISHHFPLQPEGPKLSTEGHKLTSGLNFSVVSHDPLAWTKKAPDEPILRQAIAVDPDHFTFAKHILASMKDGPVDWQDPNILPVSPQTLYQTVKFATERIIDKPTSPLPRAFKPKPTSSPTATVRPALLKRPVVKNARNAEGTTRTTSTPQSSTARPRLRPASRPAIPPSSRSLPSAPPSPPAPTTLRDVNDFYKTLDIMPGPSFLDPARESEVNLRLNLARRTLLEMYHPDQSYGLEADYEKMTEKSKAVSEAFAELKTVDKRIAYERKGQ